MPFTIRVPATSANLGSGFDCAGIAWNLYANYMFHLRQSDDNPAQAPVFSNAAAAGHHYGRNLVLDAYWRYAEMLGIALPRISVYIASDIPSTRGLGSSAACIVAGAEAARFMARRLTPPMRGGRFTDASILRVATEVEGHPDNVAPALYGGLQISRFIDGRVKACSCPLSEHLRFHVLIPDFASSTEKSRAGLPETVSRKDAVFNLSSFGFLLEGLRTGDAKLLQIGLKDRLHEPYRRPQIVQFEAWEKKAVAAGAAGLVISGAGSTLLCVSLAEAESRVEVALNEDVPKGWKVRAVRPDFVGATIAASDEEKASRKH